MFKSRKNQLILGILLLVVLILTSIFVYGYVTKNSFSNVDESKIEEAIENYELLINGEDYDSNSSTEGLSDMISKIQEEEKNNEVEQLFIEKTLNNAEIEYDSYEVRDDNLYVKLEIRPQRLSLSRNEIMTNSEDIFSKDVIEGIFEGDADSMSEEERGELQADYWLTYSSYLSETTKPTEIIEVEMDYSLSGYEMSKDEFKDLILQIIN